MKKPPDPIQTAFIITIILVSETQFNIEPCKRNEIWQKQLIHVELGVAGSGSIVIEAGTVKNADISVAGTGSVETRCELESMDYNISGWGNIYYYGDVKVKGTCMLGRIKRIDEEK